jgi:hypothetical protein
MDVHTLIIIIDHFKRLAAFALSHLTLLRNKICLIAQNGLKRQVKTAGNEAFCSLNQRMSAEFEDILA